MHKAIKTVPQINEFLRSTKLRYQYDVAENLANGMKPQDAVAKANSESAVLDRKMAAYAGLAAGYFDAGQRSAWHDRGCIKKSRYI